MSNSASQTLRKAIRDLLIPSILRHGFQQDEREAWKEDSRRFGTLRFLRSRGNSVDFLEIQNDKRGRPKFTLEFGTVPSEGVDYCGYHYSQADASALVATNRARLHPSRVLPLWRFGFPALKVPVLRNPSAADIVKQAIELLPQVEAWLKDNVKGPNISKVDLPGGAPPRAGT